jgi:hypothetical protein
VIHNFLDETRSRRDGSKIFQLELEDILSLKIDAGSNISQVPKPDTFVVPAVDVT